MISAVVLAGGLGTRLRPVVGDRPKVLAPVAGRRFLAYLLHQLADAGFEDIVLCTGYMGDQVREAFGKRFRKLNLIYSQEEQPLGTAGALRHALPLIRSDTVAVLNGDSYCQADLEKFLSWHHDQRADASILLTEMPETARFGAVEADSAGRISRFGEKNTSGPGWINAGIYAISKRLLAAIPDGVAVSIERECFPRWIADGLFGYRGGGRFLDIGTPDSFAEAQRFFSPPGSVDGSRRHVLLDRDGTLNVERDYLSDPSQLQLLPGASAGLKKLQDHGLGLTLVTNQSAIGRGYFDLVRLNQIHDRLRAMLGDEDVVLDGIYYCPHTPQEKCACRKPLTGMIDRASADLGFDPRDAFAIGDKACDMEMGRNAGATTILVRTGYGVLEEAAGVRADFIVENLDAAADVIVELATCTGAAPGIAPKSSQLPIGEDRASVAP
jgi:histidinol-phosphate phosphatase family protein